MKRAALTQVPATRIARVPRGRAFACALRGLTACALLASLGACATFSSSVPLEQTLPPKAATSEASPAQAARAERALSRIEDRADTNLLTRHLDDTQRVLDSPITFGNSVRLLVDGPDTHRAMYRAIDEARDSVNVETYILDDDNVGKDLADLLVAKSRAGLRVNLMYDSLGSLSTSDEYFARLRDAGVAICEFNPISPWRARVPWRINNRDHRKIMVADGRVAITGGINVSSVYSSGSFSRHPKERDPKTGWRDTDIEIRGPAVAELQRLFVDGWNRQRCAPLGDRDYFPKMDQSGGRAVRVIGSGPSAQGSLMYVAFLSAIRHAERSVHLTIAYFAPDRRILDALENAARRGVDVTIILPGFSDFWAPLAAGRSHYGELLESGVRLFERQEALLHAKTAVIDGVWSTVGSSNLDWRSFVLNEEDNVVVFDTAFAASMESLFQRDLARSTPVRLEQWRQRPFKERLEEWVARWFDYLL